MSVAASMSHEELVKFYNTATERISSLSIENKWLKKQLFGQKSERLLSETSDKQLSLGEGYEPEETPPPEETTVKTYERSHRKNEVQFAEDESRLKFDESV